MFITESPGHGTDDVICGTRQEEETKLNVCMESYRANHDQ